MEPQPKKFKQVTLRDILEEKQLDPNLQAFVSANHNPYGNFYGLFQEPEGVVTQIVSEMKVFWNSFTSLQNLKTENKIPTIFTGSGMGKTRFGSECLELLSTQVLKEPNSFDPILVAAFRKKRFESLFINFTSGGFDGKSEKLVQEDTLLTPSVAFGLRIAARFFFKCSFQHLLQNLDEEERKFFDIDAVFKEIGISIRSRTKSAWSKSASTVDPVILFLHVDSIQTAFESYLRFLSPILPSLEHPTMIGPYPFMQHMIQSLADYRTFSGKHDGVFVIPLLTATTSSAVDFQLIQYQSKPIHLPPLSAVAALQVGLSLNFASLIRKLGKEPKLIELIASLGVIPRSLEILNRHVMEVHVIPYQSQDDDDQTKIWILTAARLFKNSAENIYAHSIGKALTLLQNTNKFDSVAVNSLFVYLLNGTPLKWSTTFNGHNLQTIANIGLVYFQKVDGDNVHIFLPHFLLSMFCARLKQRTDWYQLDDPYTFSLLASITPFPSTMDVQFEKFVLGLLVVRIRTLFQSGVKQCQLSQLFPGAEVSQVLRKDVKLKLIKLARDKYQFIVPDKESKEKKEEEDKEENDDEEEEDEEVLPTSDMHTIKFDSCQGKKKIKTNQTHQVSDLVDQTHILRTIKLKEGKYASLTRENTALIDGRFVLDCVEKGEKPLLLLLQMNGKLQTDKEVSMWETDCLKMADAFPDFQIVPVRISNRATSIVPKPNSIFVGQRGISDFAPFLSHLLQNEPKKKK